MTDENFELDLAAAEVAFIELAAGKGVRRVRTPEGAKLFGQPIGTIITADMIKAKKKELAAQGQKIPKGALSKKPKALKAPGGQKLSPADNYGSNKPAAKVPAQKQAFGNGQQNFIDPPVVPGAENAPAGKFNVKPSTIKGSQPFSVGNAKYSAPSGSKIVLPKNQENFAYIVTPEGTVHAFNQSGELDVPDYLEPVLVKKFKDIKSDDLLYKMGSFDAPATLADQKPGSKLSKNGKPAFSKTPTGTWLNEDIGVELTDDDLQRLYDGGKFDLEPANTVEDVDFTNMSQEELQSALEAMPEGKQLKFGSGKATTTLTKKGNKWNSSLTGKDIDTEVLADTAEGTGLLTDKLDNESPVDPDPNKQAKDDKDAAAADPLMDKTKALTPENEQINKAKAAKVSGADVLDAEVGDVLYHDQLGPVVKTDKDKWFIPKNEVAYDNSDILFSANNGFLSREPYSQEQIDAKAKYDEEYKLTVDGKELKTVNRFAENERTEKIAADGGSTPPVYELEATPENAKTFHSAMMKSLEGNPYAASVYVYDEKDYEGMRLFLADDGKSGIALHDGDEIVSVFSDPQSKNKKIARHLISIAVQNGGKRLDAFDTVLPSIYAKEGFIVKARLPWNDEYAPEGWDKDTFSKFNGGEPDVVFMAYEPGMEDTEYEPGSGDYVDDYDAGLAATNGVAQDSKDYRPESGDPDNDDSTVETSPGGWVISEDTKNLLAEKKNITAMKQMIEDNPGKGTLIDAKKEVNGMINQGVAPGDKMTASLLYGANKGFKFKAVNGTEYTKNENQNWVTPNGGVYSSQAMEMGGGKYGINGEVTFNPDYKEVLPGADAPEAEDWKTLPEGANSVGNLALFEEGDIINVQTPEGTIKFTLDDDGMWLSPDGYGFTSGEMMEDVNAGKVWTNSVKTSADTTPKKKLQLGDVIKSVSQLNDMEVGDTIAYQTDTGPVKFTKSASHEFVSDKKPDFIFSHADFEEDIDLYDVFYSPKYSPNEEKSLDDKLEAGEITFAQYNSMQQQADDKEQNSKALNGTASKSQVQEAIDALDGSEKFQVKYSLKGLPESSPFKDQGYVDILQTKANEAYPGKAPKKALSAYLKKELGQEPLAPWEEALLGGGDTGPEVRVGSATPKKTQTGMTGGNFSQKDIQEAVDILENYTGKFFKNALVQKGNPLGDLSPNDIVGFNKDKTVTKQKFIDALKGKLGAPEAEAADLAILTYSQEELEEMPKGTIAEEYSPSTKEKFGDTYRSLGDGDWENVDTGSLVGSDVMQYSAWKVKEKKPFVKSTPAPEAPAEVNAKQFNDSDFKEFGPGSVIEETYDGELVNTWTMQDDMTWKSNHGSYLSTAALYGYSFKTIKKVDAAPEEASESGDPKEGDLVKGVAELNDATPGSRVGSLSKDGQVLITYQLLQNGNWTNIDGSGSQFEASEFEYLIKQNKIQWVSIGEPEAVSGDLKPGDVLVGDNTDYSVMTNLPIGSKVNWKSPSGTSTSLYEKTDYNEWKIDGDSEPYPDSQFGYGLQNKLISVNSLPAKPYDGPGEGETIDSTFTIADAVPGTVIIANGGQGGYYTKIEGDKGWANGSVAADYVPGPYDSVYSDNIIQNAVISSANDGNHYIVHKLPESVKAGISNKLQPGDVVASMGKLQALKRGDKIVWDNPNADSITYVKTDNKTWTEEGGSHFLQETAFIPSVKEKFLTYKGNVKDDPKQDDDQLMLDQLHSVALEEMRGYDNAVSILPEHLRGANGDDFVVVHTESGPQLKWGKYGGGGIATVAMDNGVKKVLIGKRGDRDEWYLPGGAIDEKESHLQGSLREFAEEVEGGDSILDNMKIIGGYQSVIGKIDGTDTDWKYVTSIADIGEVKDIKAPPSNEPWELSEYKWFSAEELEALDATGRLHGALGGGKLATMVGFDTEEPDLKVELADLLKGDPDSLGEVRYDISGWKKVGGNHGGSNPGGVYQDQIGNKWYVKENNGGDNAVHNEVVASALYSALGVPSNDLFLVRNGNSPTTMLASPWVEHDSSAAPNAIGGDDPEFLKKAQANFAIDAWLDNYDVVGIGPWNLVGVGGEPFRIDPGGAMMFRATGAEKSWWSDEPTAIDDMRFGSSQSSAYTYLPNVFGDMSDEDVKESAKKLLDITPKQISTLVMSSGLDNDAKQALVKTLVTRRQKILDRFGLSDEMELSVDDAASQIAKAQAEAPDVVHPLGTTVKVKGSGETFKVTLSNNEVAAGLDADGKYTIYLNDELTGPDDVVDVPGGGKYAFTANGKTFAKVEAVKAPNPDNPHEMIDAFVAEANWRNGQVMLVAGPKIFSTDKHNILKAEGEAPGQLALGSGYATPPLGAKALFKSKDTLIPALSSNYLVEHPDGTTHLYSPTGAAVQTYSPIENFSATEGWDAVDGNASVTPAVAPGEEPETLDLGAGWTTPPKGSVPVGKHKVAGVIAVKHPDGGIYTYYEDGVVSQDPSNMDEDFFTEGSWTPVKASDFAPGIQDAPKDVNGLPLIIGDKVTIFKGKGLNSTANIVSIKDGKAKLRLLDAEGNPLVGEDGKPKYGNIQISSLQKYQPGYVSVNGLPAGVSVSSGDPSNPLYGTDAPQAPVAQKMDASKLVFSPTWVARAEASYAKYREKNSMTAKPLQEVSGAWFQMSKALQGDEDALDAAAPYFDGDPELRDEIRAHINAQKAKVAKLIAEHQERVAEFQKKMKAWSNANGVAAYTPLSHAQAKGMSTQQAKDWAEAKYSDYVDKLTYANDENGYSLDWGIAKQKDSSDWQTEMRLLPPDVGMTLDDVKKHIDDAHSLNVYNNIKQAVELVGPIGEDVRGIRTISFDRLVGPDGQKLDQYSDLTQLIGTVQKDHGAMEVNLGASFDHGGTPGFDGYPVQMDLAIPAEVKAMYTAISGAPWEEFMNEYGSILEPGLAMYISDAVQVNGKWRVKASIIPPSVLPYMNNFAGDPTSHNIIAPGKDLTTGVPKPPKTPGPGEWTISDLNDAPAYATAMDKSGNGWTKQGDGPNAFWEDDHYGDLLKAPDFVKNYMDPGAGNWTQAQLDAAPPGKKVVDDNGDTWTKNGYGEWENAEGDSYSSSTLASDAMSPPPSGIDAI